MGKKKEHKQSYQLKTPKGTRDWDGKDMAIRESIFGTITDVVSQSRLSRKTSTEGCLVQETRSRDNRVSKGDYLWLGQTLTAMFTAHQHSN